MARRNVRIRKWSTFLQTRQACCIIQASIFFRIVIPNPSTELEESNTCLLGLLLDRCNVGCVQFFSVQESCLLQDGYPLEPVKGRLTLARGPRPLAKRLTGACCGPLLPIERSLCRRSVNTRPVNYHLRVLAPRRCQPLEGKHVRRHPTE